VKYLSTLKKLKKKLFRFIKKIIMGLSNKVTNKTNNTPQIDTTLSKQEYEKLFEALKNSNIKGEDIQVMYNVILKLQTQYVEKHITK
jgi:basic membrane lipoprotein Med (substrate-binding protein (PBP1-ABC) superfamily)